MTPSSSSSFLLPPFPSLLLLATGLLLLPTLLFTCNPKVFVQVAQAAEDGVARKPPMGWRSWNLFHGNVNQSLMVDIAKGMTIQREYPTGEPRRGGHRGHRGGRLGEAEEEEGEYASLLELGYNDVGLDDNWQLCEKAAATDYDEEDDHEVYSSDEESLSMWPFKDQTFHNASGYPLINTKKFPSMSTMVQTIHSLGLKAGWYHNNCICKETHAKHWSGKSHYQGDVNATIDFGFDSVKLDGCGAFMDLDLWYRLFEEKMTAKGEEQVMIENCHWGRRDLPHFITTTTTADDKDKTKTEEEEQLWCPFHMYRTSSDIQPHWNSMYSNLQSTKKFQDLNKPLSRPGCWAYPDMLEVGLLDTYEENRAHFGAWVITSSPLILGHDVRDDLMSKEVWSIVANTMAIGINQDWAGHPGRLVMEHRGLGGRDIQVWSKPLSEGAFAVFVLNDNDVVYYGNDNGDDDKDKDGIEVDLIDCGADPTTEYDVYNVWTQKKKTTTMRFGGEKNTKMQIEVGGHDSVFFKFVPSSSTSSSVEVSME